MATDRRVALVTGASRGVGRAIAVSLAKVGFDVAVTARTVREGSGFDISHDGTLRDLPGSVESTAAAVRAEGREALPVAMDLADPLSIGLAVGQVLEAWGHVDVLVNNAIYTGRGAQASVLDLSLADLREEIDVDIVAPLTLISLLVPAMVERGKGTVLNITSGVAYTDPLVMGSYGIGYAVGKAGLFKAAGILAVELGDRGLRAYNVHPGFIRTERMELHVADQEGLDLSWAAPPEVCGAVVAWLADDPSEDENPPKNGTNIESQQFCKERGLVEGWPAPKVEGAGSGSGSGSVRGSGGGSGAGVGAGEGGGVSGAVGVGGASGVSGAAPIRPR
jgi:NAD(P)-dependent dehydrogenase (short-subunit alcohol dehydrogenase family)